MNGIGLKRDAGVLRLARVALVGVAGLVLVGCQGAGGGNAAMEWDDDARRETNSWLLRTYQGQQVENAVTRQHTIWSHHFVQGTTSLTPRAERDLGILRDHYLKHGGGVLTVRQGEADDELYRARLAVLNSWLSDAGVPLATVAIHDDLYAGDGKRSTRAAQDYVRPSDDSPYGFHEGSKK